MGVDLVVRGTTINDKEWIVTDNNSSSPFYGRTYITWSKFASHDGFLLCRTSVLSQHSGTCDSAVAPRHGEIPARSSWSERSESRRDLTSRVARSKDSWPFRCPGRRHLQDLPRQEGSLDSLRYRSRGGEKTSRMRHRPPTAVPPWGTSGGT